VSSGTQGVVGGGKRALLVYDRLHLRF
jgi:hypothetical protein